VGHESVGPKGSGESHRNGLVYLHFFFERKKKESHAVPRKGIRLIFLNLDTERDVSASRAVTQTSSETSAKALGRVVFSL
jgi:hypothetical protein